MNQLIGKICVECGHLNNVWSASNSFVCDICKTVNDGQKTTVKEKKSRKLTPETFSMAVSNVLNHMDEVLTAKNKGYARTAENDPLINFRWKTTEGFCTRLNDKVNRLKSYVDNGETSMDKLREIYRDICGYGALGMVWCGEQEGE